MCVHLHEFMWAYVNYEDQNNLVWMFMNLREYQCDFISKYIWFIPKSFEYVLHSFEICAPADSRTLPRTLLHTATLPDTAVRFAAHRRTAHELECQTAAHRTSQTAHRTQSHTAILTWIKTIICEIMCMHLHEFTWIYVNKNNNKNIPCKQHHEA
jgi:hypothetical protein